MTQTPPKYDYRALLQQALVTLEQMEAKLRAAEQAQHEPLAIIGMGMRFPGGAYDSESFWKLLYSGMDAIGEVPPERWDADELYDPDPDAVGKMYTRWGGFLKDVDQFDPQFFGISPREAVSMDPQQRLLLETTWEALENAGQASSKLAGSRTGVFVGMVGSDYANLKMVNGGVTDVDAYFGTGISRSIAAGRIAYTLGLHGPAVAVDTACSSSLVAAHQACQSLRMKECDMAVAGGVNLILEPSGSISTSRSRMMSFDGRCKTFDAAADGYVRSEGCAMVVLKRVSDAVADGDNILAVIMGTALNQDGRSNGLTAPNGKAQEAVIRAALADAGVKASEVSYVETHGTGTSLGDPIEVRALGAVFGEGHSAANPLMIGSVKTNVGHMEAAAGIVGLVKVVLALRNKTIPPHIHLKELNPYIPWGELPITVPTHPADWPIPEGKRRIAGLSSFGFSGTNAHMIISEAPVRAAGQAEAARAERPVHLLSLSAKTEPALKELAGRIAARFGAEPELSLADAAYSLNIGRGHFTQRLALAGASISEAREKLAAWGRGEDSAGVFSGALEGEGKPEVVFLFTGQGAQYAGMARELFDTQPSFRKAMQQCEAILRPYLDKPLLSVIYPQNTEDEQLIHQTAYTQPALFAIEYALAKLWQSWGVEPAAVLGHSIGEYAAACIAGAFSLEDGLRLVAERGRLMQSLPQDGAMAAVFAGEDRVREALVPCASEVSIAAVNGPALVVISGKNSAVQAVLEALAREGVKSQAVKVSHAFHSPLIDPILDKFEEVAGSVQYHPLQIGVVSNVSGKLVTDGSLSKAAYWREHARRTVRFADGILALHEEGYRCFLEIGPSPVLIGMARRCMPAQADGAWLPSLRVGRGDWEQMLESLARLYVSGAEVDWDSFERDVKEQRRHVELPTYPFQRARYWLDFTQSVGMLEEQTGHPLLGARLPTAAPVFQKTFTVSNLGYLADHRIHGMAILPAAAYVEIALAAAQNALEGGPFSLADITIHEALPLPEDGERPAQIVLSLGEGERSFQYFSRESGADTSPWRLHARGSIRQRFAAERPGSVSIEALRARISAPVPVEDYYRHLAGAGAEYGPAFQGLEEIWRGDNEALAKIRMPEAAGSSAGYAIHPSLLDACIQLTGAALPGADDLAAASSIIYVPVEIEQLDLYAPVEGPLYCYVRLEAAKQPDAKTLKGDISLLDASGACLAVARGLILQRVDQQALRRAAHASVDPWLYEVEWFEQPRGQSRETQPGPGAWLVLGGEESFTQDLAAHLRAAGDTCFLAAPGESFASAGAGRWQVNPLHADDFRRLLVEIQAESPHPLRGVVHLWSLEGHLDDRVDLETLRATQERTCASVLHLVQALGGLGGTPPSLTLVTRGAQAAGSAQVDPAGSALWGLGKVIALEQPGLKCLRIDLDPANMDAAALFQELWSPDGEDQVAFRGGARLVARLVHASSKARPKMGDQPVELVIEERGMLENLAFRPVTRRQPGPNEVEIEVHATGLNFRDVLNTLGMYPGDAGPLGSECAGLVTAVGAEVRDFRPGDAVIALTSRSFASYVTVKTAYVVQKPARMSFAEAAGIPITFLTADYALNKLANMKAGSRVLIHAAAGGVGMAAVQLALRAGAEIFGTAGSPEKREFLKSIGVQHVFNSRTLDFAEQIMEITGGEGVDIVLNSLAGDFIPKSLAVLKEGGSFVEIGKTGVWDAEQARQEKARIDYHVLYLGEVLEEDPTLVRGMLIDLLADLDAGALQPPPLRTFPLERAVDAFRFMAQAKHIGKIALVRQAEGSPAREIRPDATYLITGGLGGLGLSCARWLAGRGARRMVLVSRGKPSPEAQEALDEIRAGGVEAAAVQGDVSCRESLAEILRGIGESGAPLRGVIHAAGVLDDGILLEQTWPRFAAVMAPKVDGAWNLHQLTLGTDLDFFILFSAGASLIGSPGQSNYAAANAFMDGLAHYRRSHGLPALAINWGAWAEVGMAARSGEQARRRWSLQGAESIRPADGMRAMERLLEEDAVQAAVLPVNWQKARRQSEDAVLPLLRRLVRPEQRGEETSRPAERAAFRDRLGQVPAEERLKFLHQWVTGEVNTVLGLEKNHPTNPRQGFTDLGLDSLMAVELSNRLQKELEHRLPSTLTFEYPTIDALAGYLAVEILALAAPDAGSMPGQAPASQEEKQAQAIIAEVESIPEESLEDALLKELKDAGY